MAQVGPAPIPIHTNMLFRSGSGGVSQLAPSTDRDAASPHVDSTSFSRSPTFTKKIDDPFGGLVRASSFDSDDESQLPLPPPIPPLPLVPPPDEAKSDISSSSSCSAGGNKIKGLIGKFSKRRGSGKENEEQQDEKGQSKPIGSLKLNFCNDGGGAEDESKGARKSGGVKVRVSNGQGTENRSALKTRTKLAVRRCTSDDEDDLLSDDEVDGVEQDPLVALFHAHSTQKVRFNLGQPVEKPEEEEDKAERKSAQVFKAFMKRTLFNQTSGKDSDDVEQFLDSADCKKSRTFLRRMKNKTAGGTDPVLRTSFTDDDDVVDEFSEDPETRREIKKCTSKARRAQETHFRYEYAIRYYLKALDLLTQGQYPENHPTKVSTLKCLQDAHHAVSSLKSSANIVKMGIRHEDGGELIKALKMYTIAYRIRRDSLGPFHPSLAVLLNMLGSVQVKRGELKEALEIYELALNGRPDDQDKTTEPRRDPLTHSVTLRDMGIIHETWGDDDRALALYDKSLDCILKSRWHISRPARISPSVKPPLLKQASAGNLRTPSPETLCSLNELRMVRSFSSGTPSPQGMLRSDKLAFDDKEEAGEMEVFLEPAAGSADISVGSGGGACFYDTLFLTLDDNKKGHASSKEVSKKKVEGDKVADVDISMTLHQIAQVYARRREYPTALSAYRASLRGMKRTLGDDHPNVAAILANIGNLHKEMGDADAAYTIYQEVLEIETKLFGLAHPELAITLHNIATIEAARGEYDSALQIYKQVFSLQKKLYGPDNITVAVTASCLGDVFERKGDVRRATNAYEEALRIRTLVLGRQHIEVGRILHKLGKIAASQNEQRSAETYVSSAAGIYRHNMLGEEHPWVRDVKRDAADVDAALALQGTEAKRTNPYFEC